MARWIAWATVSAVGASDGCSPEANSARHRALLMFSLVMASCVVVGISHHPYSAGEGSWASGSLTDREAQVLACLGEGPSNAQIAARPYLSEARVNGCVSRMLDKLGCANRAQAGLLAHDAPVSSARSPGRRSGRLELGLRARQTGLRPLSGRSCPPGATGPPGAAGLTGPPRVGGCCDHVVDAVGDELL